MEKLELQTQKHQFAPQIKIHVTPQNNKKLSPSAIFKDRNSRQSSLEQVRQVRVQKLGITIYKEN